MLNSDFQNSFAVNMCLYTFFCLVDLNQPFLQPDWHDFFFCPACSGPRDIFRDTFPRLYYMFFPGYETEDHLRDYITSLAKTVRPPKVSEVRFIRYITMIDYPYLPTGYSICRGIHACRRRAVSWLSANTPHSLLDKAFSSV